LLIVNADCPLPKTVAGWNFEYEDTLYFIIGHLNFDQFKTAINTYQE